MWFAFMLFHDLNITFGDEDGACGASRILTRKKIVPVI